MSFIADWMEAGVFPFRDHDSTKKTFLDFRAMVLGATIKKRDAGRYIYEGIEFPITADEPRRDGRSSVGELLCANFWDFKDNVEDDKLGSKPRKIPGWSMAWPVVWSHGAPGTVERGKQRDAAHGVRPVYGEPLHEDIRFFRRPVLSQTTPEIHWPAKWPGVMMSGTRELDQEDIFIPGYYGLVASWRGKDKYSSWVWDTDPVAETLDPVRAAQLHTYVRVYRQPGDGGEGLDPFLERDLDVESHLATVERMEKTEERKAAGKDVPPGLAWQLGAESFGATGGFLIPSPTPKPQVIGYMGWPKGGPLFPGFIDDKHLFSTNEDKDQFMPGHLGTWSLFAMDPDRDGPVDFRAEKWIEPTRGIMPWITEIRFDEKKEKWRLETWVSFYETPHDGWDPDPEEDVIVGKKKPPVDETPEDVPIPEPLTPYPPPPPTPVEDVIIGGGRGKDTWTKPYRRLVTPRIMGLPKIDILAQPQTGTTARQRMAYGKTVDPTDLKWWEGFCPTALRMIGWAKEANGVFTPLVGESQRYEADAAAIGGLHMISPAKSLIEATPPNTAEGTYWLSAEPDNVGFGTGTIDPAIGLTSGWGWWQDGTALTFESIDAAGATTTRIGFDDDGELLLGGSAGTSGQVPTSAGSGAAVAWGTPSIGGQAIYGGGNDSNVVISSNATLTSDMYYINLTVNNAVTLNTGGYRIFCSGTCTVNGTIASNGAAGTTGTSGTDPTAGGGGAAQGTMGGGENGGNGGWASSSTAGLSVAARGLGSAGGAGGSTGSGGIAGGTGGTVAVPATNDGGVKVIKAVPSAILWRDLASDILNGGAGGGSGAIYDNGGSTTASSGAGGGGGGCLLIVAKTLTGAGTIQANGGAGGNGWSDGTDSAEGGGGGGGGIVVLIYNSKTGSLTVQANGGAGGTGAGPHADGNAAAGTTGTVEEISNA